MSATTIRAFCACIASPRHTAEESSSFCAIPTFRALAHNVSTLPSWACRRAIINAARHRDLLGAVLARDDAALELARVDDPALRDAGRHHEETRRQAKDVV